MAQLVKNPPAMRETWIRSLGWEEPLEKGKDSPLQYSGLENAIDVHGIKHSKDQTHNILPPIFTYQYWSIGLSLPAHIPTFFLMRAILPQINLQSQHNCYKFHLVWFTEIEKLILKFIWKCKGSHGQKKSTNYIKVYLTSLVNCRASHCIYILYFI